MAGLLSPQAARDPGEIALVDDGSAATWSELDGRVNRWIHVLRGAGLAAGDRVAVVCGNRREAFEAALACLHAQLTLVPVNWHLTAPEIRHIIEDSGCRALVVDAERAPAAAVAATGVALALRTVLGRAPVAGFTPAEQILDAVTDGEPDGQCSGSVLLYTSGTSGRPKGAVNQLFRLGAPLSTITDLLGMLAGLGVPDRGRNLLVGPWYHSGQLFFSIFPLLRGCPLVVLGRFDAAGVLAAIDRQEITHCHLVPIHFVRLLGLDGPARAAFRGTSLRTVWHGASACPVEVKRRMIAWWGPVLVEYYAATEGGIATMIDSPRWLDHPGSVGRPVPPTELVIAGPDGAPVPSGVDGRVFLRRPPGRGFHYHNAPQQTRDAYLDERTFTYGDVGHVDADGYLYLTGRSIDMIITGGVNVYPAEVESVLLSHQAVRDAAVFGVPDPEFGERVVAAVVLAPGTGTGDLDAYCREHLAGFKVPRAYHAVAELPREPSGKMRKHLLRDRYTPAQAQR
ncbi:MAG TPA: AMP-binding protein [Rugosimonospora sp.]|nr:AMP-binding protein [Rugosimonospora sp.]